MVVEDKYKLVERAMFAPLALFSIRNRDMLNYIKEFLPYSVGFEIECNRGDNYNYEDFKNIPYIMGYPSQYDSSEFRFRIPYGYLGLVALYFITEACKKNLTLNEGSGVHYHVDLTDCWDIIEAKGQQELVKELEENGEGAKLIDMLDSSVHFGGRYNKKIGIGKGHWMGLRDGHRTMEFRTGQMTFEYNEIAKCIISANHVIRKFKNYLMGEDIVNQMIKDKHEEIDHEGLFNYLKSLSNYEKNKKKLQDLKNQIIQSQIHTGRDGQRSIELTLEEINQRIKNRIK